MNADLAVVPHDCPPQTESAAARACSVLIADHFRQYNEEFGRITRLAARNFINEAWAQGQRDAVERIELYEKCVSTCLAAVAALLGARAKQLTLWSDIKRGFETLIARRPDSDFYNTFFNSVTRDLFGTVGVNAQVEFCETSVGRASGAVPIRVYRVGGGLPGAVREVLSDLPFGACIGDVDGAVPRISAEIGRYFESGRHSGTPESIELICAATAFAKIHRQFRARAGRTRLGDERVHPAFARSGVQGDPRQIWRAEIHHPRRSDRALSIRIPARPGGTAGRRPGVQTAAPAARPLHAGAGR